MTGEAMQRVFLFASFLVVAVLSGCVYTDHDPAGPNGEAAFFEPKLIGDWSSAETSGDPRILEHFIRIERKSPESKTYLCSEYQVRRGENGQSDKLIELEHRRGEFHLIKIDRFLFLSVRSTTSPCYGVLKIDLKNAEELHASFLEKEFFEKHPDAVAFRSEKYNVHISADARTLREFLQAHAEDADLWSPPEDSNPLKRRERPRAEESNP
jgi:hypothetical protein